MPALTKAVKAIGTTIFNNFLSNTQSKIGDQLLFAVGIKSDNTSEKLDKIQASLDAVRSDLVNIEEQQRYGEMFKAADDFNNAMTEGIQIKFANYSKFRSDLQTLFSDFAKRNQNKDAQVVASSSGVQLFTDFMKEKGMVKAQNNEKKMRETFEQYLLEVAECYAILAISADYVLQSKKIELGLASNDLDKYQIEQDMKELVDMTEKSADWYEGFSYEFRHAYREAVDSTGFYVQWSQTWDKDWNNSLSTRSNGDTFLLCVHSGKGIQELNLLNDDTHVTKHQFTGRYGNFCGSLFHKEEKFHALVMNDSGNVNLFRYNEPANKNDKFTCDNTWWYNEGTFKYDKVISATADFNGNFICASMNDDGVVKHYKMKDGNQLEQVTKYMLGTSIKTNSSVSVFMSSTGPRVVSMGDTGTLIGRRAYFHVNRVFQGSIVDGFGKHMNAGWWNGSGSCIRGADYVLTTAWTGWIQLDKVTGGNETTAVWGVKWNDNWKGTMSWGYDFVLGVQQPVVYMFFTNLDGSVRYCKYLFMKYDASVLPARQEITTKK